MPLATIHLISVAPSRTLLGLIEGIRATSTHQLILLSKPIRWIITPEQVDKDALLSPSSPWDLLYMHVGTEPLHPSITIHIRDHYTVHTGIPSRLLNDFATTNQTLLHPQPSSVPELTGALDEPVLSPSSQDLSMSPDLQSWISTFSQTKYGKSAVSMLNFLAFVPEQKAAYVKYGQEFARSIGSRRGGNAKLVGNIIQQLPHHQQRKQRDEFTGLKWDEFALAHYPSILHFADMIASNDYQAINQQYRVGALKDTCILCTSEIAIEGLLDDTEAVISRESKL